jgi:signal transduction histidine kinase
LGGIGLRIAAAAIVVSAVAMAIMAIGVIVVGGMSFTELMAVRGEPTAAAQSMFEGSVVKVVLVSAGVAVIAAVILAAFLGPRLARPMREIEAAARRVAQGQFGARIPRGGPSEIVSLADSFNQMAASLEEQERMRREFIANAAHELRTPLTNLKGYLEALRDGVISPDRTTFESLLEEVDRLVRLSRSLDTLAKGDVAGPAVAVELDVGRAIRAAVELAQPAVRAGGLILELDVPNALSARADADRVAQILGNLLQNAIRYTPAGGTIAVRGRRQSGEVLVSVSNSGDGIPAADLPHVFERFYRVDKSRDAQRGGAGIGLAIVRQLVEAGGGTVGAESRDGLTLFWFSLPS